MKQRIKADGGEVRQWAYDHHWTDKYDREVADVGRLPSKLIRDFEKATGKEYVVAWDNPTAEPEPPEDDLVEVRLLIPRSLVSSMLPEQSRSRKSERH